jgi:hypothetical protein
MRKEIARRLILKIKRPAPILLFPILQGFVCGFPKPVDAIPFLPIWPGGRNPMLKINLNLWDGLINFIRAYALNIAIFIVIIAVFIILGAINYLYLTSPDTIAIKQMYEQLSQAKGATP